MSSLKVILNKMPSEAQHRYSEIIQTLISFGIYTVQDLQQCSNDTDFSKRTNIPHNVICQLQQNISYEVSTYLQKSAADLWEQEQSSGLDIALSTGNPLLDQTLSSKLVTDNITEIYGLGPIEKLEICLNMLLSMEDTNREILVYYVDMGNRFDAYQLQELYLSPKYHIYRERGITLQHVLSRIHCVQCRSFRSLLLFLERSTSQLGRLPKKLSPIQLVFLDGWDLLELPLDITQVTYYVSMTMHYLSLSKTDDSSLLLVRIFRDSSGNLCSMMLVNSTSVNYIRSILRLTSSRMWAFAGATSPINRSLCMVDKINKDTKLN